MANKRTVKLNNAYSRNHACKLVMEAPQGFVVVIGEETRSQEQNRLMWPLIQDMQNQLPDMAAFSADDVKLRFLHSLGQELRFLPNLEGTGLFPVGQRSSTLSKSQFSALLDLMFEYGGRNGVEWSAKSLATMDEIRGYERAA